MVGQLGEGFELLDGGLVAQQGAWGHAGDFGCVLVVVVYYEVVELAQEDVVDTWKVVTACDAKS